MRTLVYGVSFLVMLGFSRTSLAQPMVPGGGAQRPAVSPYINLLRGNSGINNAALGYYGIVRPEQAFRQQAGQLQQQLNQTNQNLNAVSEGEQPLITGKGATFMNYSHYFNTMGGGGGSSSFSGRGPGGGSGSGVGVGVSAGSGSSGRSSGFTIGQAPQGGARRR